MSLVIKSLEDLDQVLLLNQEEDNVITIVNPTKEATVQITQQVNKANQPIVFIQQTPSPSEPNQLPAAIIAKGITERIAQDFKSAELTEEDRIRDLITNLVDNRGNREIKRIISAVAAKQQLNFLLHGYSDNCYVEGVTSLERLFDFIGDLGKVVDNRNIAGGHELYTLEIGANWKAFTDQVTYEQLYCEGKASFIRSDRRKPVHNRKVVSCAAPYVEGEPLRRTNVATFVVDKKLGLLRWKPGIFVDTLLVDEQCGWVSIKK